MVNQSTNPFMLFNSAQLKWADMARTLMDRLYLKLELPNQFGPDFWLVYEEKISHLVSPKLLKLLKDVYPSGPRYVQSTKEGLCHDRSGPTIG